MNAMRHAALAGVWLAVANSALATPPSTAQSGKTLTGATFAIADGWTEHVTGAVVMLDAPETDTHLAIVDVTRVADAKSAAAAAWELYRPGASRPLKLLTTRASRDGWDEQAVIDYETSPGEHLDIRSIVRRHVTGACWESHQPPWQEYRRQAKTRQSGHRLRRGAISSAGGAWSSPHDMILYMRNELTEGVLPTGRRLVSASNLLARRQRGVSLGEDQWYGMGLVEDATWGVSFIDHGGDIPGYHSDFFVIPSAQVGAVILTNSELLIHGARAVLTHSKAPPEWLTELAKRRPKNVAVVAMANKMARTIWALMAHERAYQFGYVSRSVDPLWFPGPLRGLVSGLL